MEALPRLRARAGLTVKSFPVAYQYMMWMNTRRAPLADVRVRRALVLYAYPQRPDLVTFLPVLKALYGQIGVAVETRLTEAVSQLAAAHDFDLLLWAQHTVPAGDPAFFLNMFLRTD